MTYGHTTSKCEKSKYEPRNTKKNAYICITESLCCTEEINTTLSINYISIRKKKFEARFFPLHMAHDYGPLR